MKKGQEVRTCTRSDSGNVVCTGGSRPPSIEIGGHRGANNQPTINLPTTRYTFQPAIHQHPTSTFRFPISPAASNHSLIENPISVAGISALMNQFQARNRQRANAKKFSS